MGRRPRQTFRGLVGCSLALRPACSRDRQSGPLRRRLRRLRYLHRRSDCYRLERTSCRVGVAPTEDLHLFTATMSHFRGPFSRTACGLTSRGRRRASGCGTPYGNRLDIAAILGYRGSRTNRRENARPGQSGRSALIPASRQRIWLSAQAYAKRYTNAYETDDMAAVEASIKRAHDAAQKALLLDLGSEKARHAVDDLQRRLAKLPPKG